MIALSEIQGLHKLYDETEKRCEKEFRSSLPYYRERGAACFLSYCSFWETHPFPQQSLAYILSQNGIRSHWYDGPSFLSSYSHVSHPNQNLSVSHLLRIPGERFSLVSKTNLEMNAYLVNRSLRNLGRKPLVWIHGGLNNALVERLPYVDIFSFFDDINRHSINESLCKSAKIITTQNAHALSYLKGRGDTHFFLPPLSIDRQFFSESSRKIEIPKTFPKLRMGYFGTLLYQYFDFELFEKMLMQLPDVGFIIGGRVDTRGSEYISRLKAHKNFIYLPTVPRVEVVSYWKLIDVCLLLYRDNPGQIGAFASKALEAVSLGIPIVGTECPKMELLHRYFPVSNNVETLIKGALQVSSGSQQNTEAAFRYLFYEMHPKHQLAVLAELLGKA